MGKQSTRENKTIYQICREEAGLTRSEASEKMTAVSDSKIEKFEYEMQEPTPYDIIQMADDSGRYLHQLCKMPGTCKRKSRNSGRIRRIIHEMGGISRRRLNA